jgi:protein-disulfide isomerase
MDTRFTFSRLATTLLLALTLLTLAACGPSNTPETTPDEAALATTETAESASPTRPGLFEAPIAAPGDDTTAPVSSAAADELDGVPVGFLADGRPYRGNANAPVRLEEFSDYQCPFCARYNMQTLPTLLQNQVANGEVMIVFYDFPLNNIHPQAEAAANAARCAAEQGAAAYWQMHDMLFARLNEWSGNNADAAFNDYAAELGLDMAAFTECARSNRYADDIQADLEYGMGRGVSSTPSFFLNDQPLIGAQPLEVFNQAIATIQGGGELTAEQPAQPAQPTPMPISEEGIAATWGDPAAPYTIVEFTDFGCEACAHHALNTLPEIVAMLVDTGRVEYVLKDFPQDSQHPEARAAAVAARCAGEQEQYWPMYETLFANQAEWNDKGEAANAIFSGLAENLELDTAVFDECLTSGRFDAAVQAGLDEGTELGVDGLPYLFIEGYPLSAAEPNAVALALNLPLNVPIGDAFTLGDVDAPITIIEYTDYQCPFCTRHFLETYPLIKENFIDKGLVRYVFKDFPLTSIHPQAVKAAEAARCAGVQGAYEPMHDALFANQSLWSGQTNAIDLFVGYGVNMGLDGDALRACLESGEMETAVMNDLAEGMSFGVNGTPAFFINGYAISGALPYAEFETGLNSLLAEMGQQ